MLTVLHPELLPVIQELNVGLMSVSALGEDLPRLVVKAPKEVLLAAKLDRGFRIYVAPVEYAGRKTFALISAFHDDEDEPQVIYTPLFDDEASRQLISLLSSRSFDVHLFDEHDRELLGYAATACCPNGTLENLVGTLLVRFDISLAKAALDQLPAWFGQRSPDDDRSALRIAFSEELMPSDIFLIDARPENHDFQGSAPFTCSQLERDEPGAFQEHDIANLLKNLFPPSCIFLNPLRATDNEEIADLLVITDSDVVVIQAKDRPNVEQVLRNPLARKKAATRNALAKAIRQTRGALRYLRSTCPARMIVAGDTVEIDISRHAIRALIVVKELFEDEYSDYSSPTLELSRKAQAPCIVLDYPELWMWASRLDSQNAFFGAFDRVFEHGARTGTFPRLRIWHHKLGSQALKTL